MTVTSLIRSKSLQQPHSSVKQVSIFFHVFIFFFFLFFFFFSFYIFEVMYLQARLLKKCEQNIPRF